MPKRERKRRSPPRKVETVRHKDKRKNIPTEELRDFVREDEQQPRKVLYPRDPDLDPQLVWKGKDEQDAAPLEVPAVPVYIQEKIHPQAIIEDFKATAAKADKAEAQLDLFSDFNGLPEDFADRVDFYHHEGNWSNRLILGDSLFVMTSLAEKENLKGRVQMIYIDPPYGIKFGSNWQVSTRKHDVRDGKAEDLVRQPEQVKAFRDTWELGIHSYLAYLRDRLVVARDLLTESGSVFVQIGDENVHLVRSLLDEVLGSENFVSLISFRTKIPLNPIHIANIADFVVWYAKDKEKLKFRRIFKPRDTGDDSVYSPVEGPTGEERIATLVDLMASGHTESCHFEFFHEGRRAFPPGRNSWKTTPQGMRRLIGAGRVRWMKTVPRFLGFAQDYPVMEYSNQWTDTQGAAGKSYVVQTADKVIGRCLLMTTDPGDLVLDPTCGSGTTAYVAEQWGRRWITIDTSRVALTLARTRLMAARFPYYHLADDYPETGQMTDEEIKAHLRKAPPAATSMQDVRKGFVYKRVPHVTIGSIANNEEIDAIHGRWQQRIEPVLKDLNKQLKKRWREWEVPREPERDWPKEAKGLLKDFWSLRRKRQEEIDACIARRADQEVLYDQPYQDSRRVRVAGPFTVESLSPHRTISVEEKKALTEVGKDGWKMKVVGPDDFGRMILENMRTAGVNNRFKGERMKFDSLEPYAGQWIQGRGQYAGKDGKAQRVAVCIGPEHGTVGPELVKEAAKEAVQGVGFDVLIVCGFAFDAHVSEEAKRYGKLVVLPTKIDDDLAMGGLLKKTGSGGLFTVFAEPDVKLTRAKDGKVTVEIRGLDVYDPTTGEIRSSSTDDIACWFVDTNYSGESFFVRHAYFTGADEPYDKLKRALRAEVDEAAWSELYSTKSRPFAKPETGKIAIKVINHYGDEVLKVYECKG